MTVIDQLNEKIETMVSRFDTMKEENIRLQNEVVSAKAQSEAKDSLITKLEEDISMKDLEIEDIVKKIELALGWVKK